MTTRIITFLIGNPYKPSFVTVTGWGVDLIYIYIYMCDCFPGHKTDTGNMGDYSRLIVINF